MTVDANKYSKKENFLSSYEKMDESSRTNNNSTEIYNDIITIQSSPATRITTTPDSINNTRLDYTEKTPIYHPEEKQPPPRNSLREMNNKELMMKRKPFYKREKAVLMKTLDSVFFPPQKKIAEDKTTIFYEIPHRRVDLLKVDVEGFQDDVFEGAQRTLETWKPVILFESQNYTTIPKILRRIGYLVRM